MIKRALISVSNKEDIVEFSKELSNLGIEIISTGGTARILKENGIKVLEVSEYTGFPEMLSGRIKTLHPKIHGGLLGRRDREDHLTQMVKQGIEIIDMVVVNLYPFEATIAKEECSLEEAIENIDIGGPAMLRAAAKNYPFVTVICDPKDYQMVLRELCQRKGEVSKETNFYLAQKVFSYTARYDGVISSFLGAIAEGGRERFSSVLNLQFIKKQDLRYGENPHQKAAFYVEEGAGETCVANAVKLQGKELSFNNILDLDSALETVREFEEPASVIIKHQNPCGAATSERDLKEAYCKARECDPLSAFGGIVGLNRRLDKATALEIIDTFMEAVIAPDYDADALKIFHGRKDLRILKVPFSLDQFSGGYDMKKVVGGLLLQERDLGKVDVAKLKVVTRRSPTHRELKALDFAWKVCKHVKSNAIVYAKEDQVVGIGAGQTSRVDAAKIGIIKANLPTQESVVASDAMFPFRDSVDIIAQAGATAIIQPGGSLKDPEVIKACDEHNIAMIFTQIRHFRH